MEPRLSRPLFWNPFTEGKRKGFGHSPSILRGFFRAMPMHYWSAHHIQIILGYAAAHPTLFGFPPQPTCIVNTAYLLPSMRSRTQGVWAFGVERGCKSIIIPASCSDEPFDAVDAKLVEPLLRWNPGVEYLYLSRSCQALGPALIPLLVRCPHLKEVTLEGWDNAVAIHKVMMACRRAEVLDTFSLDDRPREWKNELSVQALCTLTEMHPRLRAVKSHRLYLEDWLGATRYSRCRHNVAQIVFVCDWVILLYSFFAILVAIPAFATYRLLRRFLSLTSLTENYVFFWSTIAGFAVWMSGLLVDYIVCGKYGRAWVNLTKLSILARYRLEVLIRRHQQNSLVVQK